MSKYKFLIIYIALCCNMSGVKAQGIWGRLKQKAEQIGERVIDKTVDDILEADKHPQKSDRKDDKGPESSETPIQGRPQEKTSTEETGIRRSDHVAITTMIRTDTIFYGTDTVYRFNTSSITAREFVAYAKTLKGTPYSYGSTDPSFGLDCSGFITHVFTHFNIQVPRRAFDFKNAEKKVQLREAKPGDLILFAGSDKLQTAPGHMGIIVSKQGKDIEFIHASSGTMNGVTTSLLSNSYFKDRFLDVVRVF